MGRIAGRASPFHLTSAADLFYKQEFQKALVQLPEDQREAIILVGASGLSYEEATAIWGCAVRMDKSRVSRARTRLGEILQITDSSEFGPDDVATHVVNRPLVGNDA